MSLLNLLYYHNILTDDQMIFHVFVLKSKYVKKKICCLHKKLCKFVQTIFYIKMKKVRHPQAQQLKTLITRQWIYTQGGANSMEKKIQIKWHCVMIIN